MQFPSMTIGEVYFYTATILNWQKLLASDKYKDIIVQTLHHLVTRRKIAVYAFVIMPNHVHFIWEMLAKNGKEMPHASFMKFTAHEFLKDLKIHHPKVFPYFQVNITSRKYQFWQRNSLPKILYSPKIWEQKMDYIHENPVQGKWNLAQIPENYYYSSAQFYEEGIDNFGFLTHYRDRC